MIDSQSSLVFSFSISGCVFPSYDNSLSSFNSCSMNTLMSSQSVKYQSVRVLSAQLCLTICNPMDSSPPGPSVHGILQARILQCVAISYFRGTSRPRNKGLPLWLSWERISLQCGRPGFDPWVGKIPRRKERLATPACGLEKAWRIQWNV